MQGVPRQRYLMFTKCASKETARKHSGDVVQDQRKRFTFAGFGVRQSVLSLLPSGCCAFLTFAQNNPTVKRLSEAESHCFIVEYVNLKCSGMILWLQLLV